jgi:hypothetical protein
VELGLVLQCVQAIWAPAFLQVDVNLEEKHTEVRTLAASGRSPEWQEACTGFCHQALGKPVTPVSSAPPWPWVTHSLSSKKQLDEPGSGNPCTHIPHPKLEGNLGLP